MMQTDRPAPYLTITFEVSEEYKSRIAEVVHEDGISRVQIVEESTNPRYHALLKEMERLKGNGAVLNTSMNRRGRATVCSPTDAFNMFYGSDSDLEYLMPEGLLVT
jgi:carbamoyltransferase